MKLLAIVAPIVATAAIVVLARGTASSDRVIGGYSTSLVGRTPNQMHNARLASDRLDGIVIQPGESLSFVQAVGSWTADRGYRKAPVSYNGQLIDAWGGGVCQTSTTLYNAALLAGLTVTERHRHRFAPTYCPPGRDSAVAFDNIDLKIKNNFRKPVKLLMKVRNGAIVAQFWSDQILREKPELVTRITQRVAPTLVEFGQGDKRKLRNGGKPGFEVSTYRLWRDRRELVSVDSYPVMNRVIENSGVSVD